jgi:photosystem II stability/assembly factor-like uncharacterized protein
MKFGNLVILLLFGMVPLTGNAFASGSPVTGADLPVSPSGSVSSPNYRLSPRPGQTLSDGRADSSAIALLGGSYPSLLVERLLSKRVSGFVLDGANIWVSMSGSGIMRSSNSGQTWAGATTQPANRRIKGLVIHPKSRTTLFAVSSGSGVFTSTDSGDTWTACANTGLSAAALNGVSMAIDPAGILYAGTEAGIFKSRDCSSWSAVSSGQPASATASPVAIAVDPAAPDRLYAGLDGAGIFRSSDSGASWLPATTQPANKKIKALAVAPGDGARLYAATYGNGVITSTDSGVTWRACANSGMTNLIVVSLLLDESNKLYAGTERGLFISDDSCASWATLLGKGPQ